MVVKRPTAINVLNEGIEGHNLVIGGIIGAYLGFSISRDGVVNGNYAGLSALILGTSWFASLLLFIPRRIFDGYNNVNFIVFSFSSLFFPLLMAMFGARSLGLDDKLLAVILACWTFLVAAEIGSAILFKNLPKAKKDD